jgi:hypothetical protein
MIGIALSSAVRLLAITSPYSAINPRSVFICMVRNLIFCWRIRCSANTACWASVFTATALLGIWLAIQIARASLMTSVSESKCGSGRGIYIE